jgi:MYXO-CTERM domain-containing protein
MRVLFALPALAVLSFTSLVLSPLVPNPDSVLDSVDTGSKESDTIDSGSIDADGDGYTIAEGDCDDTDPTVNPGADDDTGDDIDQDCDGVDGVAIDTNGQFDTHNYIAASGLTDEKGGCACASGPNPGGLGLLVVLALALRERRRPGSRRWLSEKASRHSQVGVSFSSRSCSSRAG